MYPVHPARLIPYRDLRDGLREAVEKRLVFEQASGDLRLYCYAPACVYDRAWTDVTLAARGLVLDVKREAVVATSFPKFFNHGERGEPIPDLGFDVFEKLDGSLIVIFYDQAHGGWCCATKGSFRSDQAKAAARWLTDQNLSELRPGYTYLCEYVAPDNRIVVPYDRTELVLLGLYDEEGCEPLWPVVQATADRLGWRAAERHAFASIAELVSHAADLPATREGFVVRFTNGLRLKIKGDEYRRIHALISRVTPLALWEALAAGDDLTAIRRQLPEEFWVDFDAILSIIEGSVSDVIQAVVIEARNVANLSDKELGLRLAEYPEPIRGFLFPYRKSGGDLLSGRARQALFRAVRPTGNVLAGYRPSYAMNRVAEESI